MKFNWQMACFWFFFLLEAVIGGHYLIWMPMSTKSVKIGVMDIGFELAKRGHNVTVVSPFKSNKETVGVTEIVNESKLGELQKDVTEDLLVKEGASIPVSTFIQVSMDDNRNALQLPQIKELLDTKTIDVVIAIPMFGNEAGYYLAHKKNASLALVLTGTVSIPVTNWAVGDTFNPSYVPLALFGYSYEMNFVQRFTNTLATAAVYALVNFYSRPKVEALLRDIFPSDPEIPRISQLAENTGLLINHGSPFLGDGLRPVMPKTVLAGLMTCAPAKPLPENLKEFVDTAEHGVIFVSFGSVIKSSRMPESKRQMFLSVFSKLKERIIWKWEVDMPDAPPNVLLSSWLPQPDLLGHPNVKLFITHGGAGSVQETICHQTPLVGIPIGGDPLFNINQAVEKKIGVKVDWLTMTEDILTEAVNEVLSTTSYSEQVTRLSDLVLDQPQHPLERAVWWMEYLLRHPGNKDMRSPALDLWWFQYFLIDVLLAFVFIVTIVILLLRLILCSCYKKFVQTIKDKKE